MREAGEEDKFRRAEAQRKAAAIWDQATVAPNDHPYLVQKRVAAHGARLHDQALVIPLYSHDELRSLQFIEPSGQKRFLTGGRVAGCYFLIGTIQKATALCIAEGFATGASIHEATGHPVAVAFNAGNLEYVSKALSENYPSLPLIICADDDASTEGNPGITKATVAAQSVGGLSAIPDFGAERPAYSTDFNDLAKYCGRDAVKRVIGRSSWPEPSPLTARLEPVPYQLDALPETIRLAVEEVLGFTKAPVPLVASSALSAISVAIQAHVNVARADKLTGPVGTYFLTIADSGERKSTGDEFFTSEIRKYDEEQRKLAEPELKRHEAEYAAWAAERDGILAAIKQYAKTNKPVDELKTRLTSLEQKQPKPPRVPNLMRGDDTPENLAWVLARQWPSAGVITAEAGLVLGAHGMGSDSILRNLGLLNILLGRRSAESRTQDLGFF
jgi:putative DNA primase/helicase